MKAILIAAAVAAVSLATPHAASAADGWKDQFKTVRFGVLSGENEKDRLTRWTPFKDYLQKELGVDVEIYTAGSYDGVIQALAADQIEFAFLGSSAYAAAYTETNGGVEPLLASIDKDGATGYYSIVTVRCDSGYKSLDDLKGKVLAFADPDSTSGYAVPYFNLVQEGYDPKTYFSAIPFSGSHEFGVQGVETRQYDAAATYENSDVDGIYQRMVQKGMIPEGDICSIWKSPEITNGPLAARTNLPQDLIDAMTQTVMDYPTKDPEAFKKQNGPTSTDVGYVKVDHSRYQWIVDMRDWLKQQRRDD
jgi:phosphonate transport system substrate-binding protein